MRLDFKAAYHALADKLEAWFRTLILMVPNIVLALLVMVAGGLIAKLIKAAMDRILRRLGMKDPGRSLLARSLQFVIIIVSLGISLQVLNLDEAAMSLLAGAGIIGVAIGFAFQDIASNFMAGIYMSMRHPFRIGDLIETNDVFGTAERILLRTTAIRTQQGQMVLVPNKKIFAEKLTNYTYYGIRRIDLVFEVSHRDDLELIRQVSIAAVEQVSARDPTKNVDLYFGRISSRGIMLEVRFWIPFAKQPDFLAARSEAIMRLKRAFADHGLDFPAPRYSVEVETGPAKANVTEQRAKPSSNGRH